MSRETPNELVLTVGSDAAMGLFLARGSKEFLPAAAVPDFGEWLGRHAEFIRRPRAEELWSHRHLTTYTILTSGDRVFAYRRGESGSEGRLAGRLSIGVGGHLTLDRDFLQDARTGLPAWLDMIEYAALREVDEEVSCDPAEREDRLVTFAGLIASHETPVDRVHLGCVTRWHLLSPDAVVPREDCLAEPAWLTVDELRARRDELENWSKIVLDHVLAPSRPATAGEVT